MAGGYANMAGGYSLLLNRKHLFIHGPYTSKLCHMFDSKEWKHIHNMKSKWTPARRTSVLELIVFRFHASVFGGDLGGEVNPLEGYNPFCPPTISVKREHLPQKGRELRHMYICVYIYIYSKCVIISTESTV